MIIRPLKITLLNHLFYHTETTNGSVTGGFIGDLALSFAVRKALSENDTTYVFRKKPNYESILDYGFYCTVAKPVTSVIKKGKNKQYVTENKPKRTGTYTRNTLYNTDGYTDTKSFEKAGKSPFTSLFKTQGIAAESEFLCLWIAKEGIEPPETIRIGNQKETLAQLNIISEEEAGNDFWLNAYSLKTIFNNYEQAVNLTIEQNKANFHFILENYALIKNFTLKDIKLLFENCFPNG